ncbi:MAG TPA: NAD(P)H-dependent oxidoreductase subunit E, partial [Candidatus Acidoferrum sp.]
MELHFTNDQASPVEKSAVDLVLGPPHSPWTGAARTAVNNGHMALAEGNRRDLLLPLLHAVQSRAGWLSPGALNYIALRLDVPPSEVHSVASFYGLFSLKPRPPAIVHVCDDIACLTKGSGALCHQLEQTLGPEGVPTANGKLAWHRSACLGLCERAPAALLIEAGENPRDVVLAPATLPAIESALNGEGQADDGSPAPSSVVPQAADPNLRLLRRVGRIRPTSLDDYRRDGGYDALRRAFQIGPEAVVREVIDSRLLGRGGAAFPTGKKWEALLAQRSAGSVHYVVCNADESEPGTFKDRVILENDPFSVLEGLTIAAFAVGAKQGYIYLRGEYPVALIRLNEAIRAARDGRLLGNAILGSDFVFDVEVRRGAGAYICGEETALFNSVEGFRGEPRNKPPFPTQSGLFRRPTVVNNVETLINVPDILLLGGAAFARIGTAQSTGDRLFCLSGHVAKPGLYEAPFGVTARALIDRAGGVGGNGRLQAVLLGGAAGCFLSPAELDTPLTFEGVRAIGATLGSGVVMLFDDSVDLRQILARITRFFREESCGQCVP